MSLNFTSASDGLTRSGLALSSTAFSECGWVTQTATSGGSGPSILTVRDNNSTGDIVGFQLTEVFGSTTFTLLTPSSSVSMFTASLNQPYFVAYTINGTTYTAYWSQAGGGGTLSSNSGTDATAIGSYSDLFIGGEGGSVVEARLAAVNIWSGVVLTTAQIQNQMASQRPQFTANLFGQYPMFSQADGNVDFSGGGHTLTWPATKPTTDSGPPAAWNFLIASAGRSQPAVR